jgi:hypothetical protein
MIKLLFFFAKMKRKENSSNSSFPNLFSQAKVSKMRQIDMERLYSKCQSKMREKNIVWVAPLSGLIAECLAAMIKR